MNSLKRWIDSYEDTRPGAHAQSDGSMRFMAIFLWGMIVLGILFG